MYNDDYPNCDPKHATLCTYHRDLEPQHISALLGIEPTESFRRDPKSSGGASRKRGALFLSFEHTVLSRDVRRHVDWLLDRLTGKAEKNTCRYSRPVTRCTFRATGYQSQGMVALCLTPTPCKGWRKPIYRFGLMSTFSEKILAAQI